MIGTMLEIAKQLADDEPFGDGPVRIVVFLLLGRDGDIVDLGANDPHDDEAEQQHRDGVEPAVQIPDEQRHGVTAVRERPAERAGGDAAGALLRFGGRFYQGDVGFHGVIIAS